jgi:hypothetical protein
VQAGSRATTHAINDRGSLEGILTLDDAIELRSEELTDLAKLMAENKNGNEPEFERAARDCTLAKMCAKPLKYSAASMGLVQ